MFDKILIANRGEIACRVLRSARKLGIGTVAVYSDADRDAVHVGLADEAVRIGPAPAAESYLIAEKILEACRQTGADAVHPGYGFLSERAGFCEMLEAAGIVFIGPKPPAIRAMGDKITAKKIAAEANVSTVPGHMGLIDDAEHAVRIAAKIGYPVMIKASAGGGGKGMRIARTDDEAREGFARSKSEAASSFGDDRIFIEKFVESPRHIEIQILADGHGNCIHLGERECSIQRRNQKVVEEAPSPFLDSETRAAMGAQAVALARAVDYQSAGTVEFIVDRHRNFYFLEMNTRLQVEHPVTELVTGVDLVEQMIHIAAGDRLCLSQADVRLSGWAIESRIYAEDPYRGFLPSIGRLTRYIPPPEGASGATRVRNDTGVTEGSEISLYYDPMIAKLCTFGPDREQAIGAMSEALDRFVLEGIAHNVPFLSHLMAHPRWRSGDLTTGFIAEEYPDGFSRIEPGPEALELLALAAIAIDQRLRRRLGSLADGPAITAPAALPAERVVLVGASAFAARIEADGESLRITRPGAEPRTISTDWMPGMPIAELTVDGRTLPVRVDRSGSGVRLRRRGLDLVARVVTPRVAELVRLMPDKAEDDSANLLLCPMPGLVVSLEVAEGDAVEPGQALAVIEAMKMENILRAERAATVAGIKVKPGDSLAVDDVIMEFV